MTVCMWKQKKQLALARLNSRNRPKLNKTAFKTKSKDSIFLRPRCKCQGCDRLCFCSCPRWRFESKGWRHVLARVWTPKTDSYGTYKWISDIAGVTPSPSASEIFQILTQPSREPDARIDGSNGQKFSPQTILLWAESTAEASKNGGSALSFLYQRHSLRSLPEDALKHKTRKS
jgi:hypothetical protein